MQRTFPTLALLFVLPLRLFAQAAAPTNTSPLMQPALGEKLQIAGVHNAGKITDFLYRGAQPKQTGLSELKLLGINTIVDLRGEDREKIDWERKRDRKSTRLNSSHVA